MLWFLDKISSPEMSPLRGTPESPDPLAGFQLRVCGLRGTLLDYLSTIFTNLQMSGDSQRLLGDYLGDYLQEYLREYLRQISWNLREITIPRIWRFVETVEIL